LKNYNERDWCAQKDSIFSKLISERNKMKTFTSVSKSERVYSPLKTMLRIITEAQEMIRKRSSEREQTEQSDAKRKLPGKTKGLGKRTRRQRQSK
jgi:abortive infection bacteriophage resistance protein